MAKLTASQAAFILELKSRKLADPIRDTTRPMLKAERKATRILAKAGFYKKPDHFAAEFKDYEHHLTPGVKAKLDALDRKIDANCIRSAGHLGSICQGRP